MEFVRPLSTAHNMFLEVLLTEYDLTRDDNGAHLEVWFDDNVPAIWLNLGKNEVEKGIPDFDTKRRAYQSELEDILLRGSRKPFRHRDSDFPFRYVSGGTLPIITFGDKQYYCMFYREIDPIGWNIANGGSDSREELLNPLGAVERELQEEILAFDVDKRKLFAFGFAGAKPFVRPEFVGARLFWQGQSERLGLPGFDEMQEEVLGVGWIDGPDSLTVRLKGDAVREHSNLFLNINALDFGIEVDRIGMINLYDGVSICDGEVGTRGMVNAPVGLFEVDKTNQAVVNNQDELLPDLLFYTGQPRDRGDVEQVVSKEFVPRMERVHHEWDSSKWHASTVKFGLCPVTRNIIIRYEQVLRENATTAPPPQPTKDGGYEVFISYPFSDGEARGMAAELDQKLKKAGKSVSRSGAHRDSQFAKAINRALVSANSFVAVLTDPEQVYRSWIEYECTTFMTLMHNGQKVDPKMLSLISGFDEHQLLPPLTTSKSFPITAMDDIIRQIG